MADTVTNPAERNASLIQTIRLLISRSARFGFEIAGHPALRPGNTAVLFRLKFGSLGLTHAAFLMLQVALVDREVNGL